MTYYAVCDANGPISVALAGATEAEAIESFGGLDCGAVIDDARTDLEDALDIDGAGMDEDVFGAALEAAGAERVLDLAPIINAQAGTVAHLSGGWMLWSVAD